MESTVITTKAAPQILAELKRMVLEITQLKLAPEQIRDDANLYNDCGLDSTSVVDLILTLEEEFGISISEDELDVRLFQNLECLGSFVESKRAIAPQ